MSSEREETLAWRSQSLIEQLDTQCPFSKRELKFSASEYSSNDGMQTAIFGPVLWTGIHLISFNYPTHPTTEDKENYENYMMYLGRILPCKYCRDNYPENYEDAKQGKDVYKNRDSFSRFCHRLHSCVNEMLNKKGQEPTFEELRDVYEGFRSRCLTRVEEEKEYEKARELGCVSEKHAGTKGKCVVNIVPRNYCSESLIVSKECAGA